jgi:hypothetical protein
MSQKNQPTIPQAKGSPAGHYLSNLLLAKESIARAVYTVLSTDQTVHQLHADTGLLRIGAVSYPVFVAFAENPAGTGGQAYTTLTLASNPVNGDTMTLGDQDYYFYEYINGKAHSTLTLGGVITPGKHAESVLTTNGTNPGYGENVVIGAKTYRFTDALVRAARGTLTVSDVPHEGTTIVAGTKTYKWRVAIGAGALATGTLTLGANAADGKVVVIGTRTYTFKDTLTGAADEVLVEASASASLDNLIAAITAGAGVGVKYGTGTVAHAVVTAVAGDGDTMVATAKAVGFAGNVASTTDIATSSWASGTLIGGIDAQAANDVLIGASAEISIDNLVLAITGGAGIGTNYGTGTVASTQFTAVKATAATMTVTASTAGAAGNSIATTTTADHCAFGATTLVNGHDMTANDVLIGVSAAITLDNLKSAINGSTGAGTTYATGTTANATVVATDNADTTQKVIARVPGVAANTTGTTTTSATYSWPAATLGDGAGASNPGVAAETVTLDTVTYSFVDVLSETNGASAIANQVLFGADSAAALDNLKLAINLGATIGTNYSTGTVVHPTVTATTNTNSTQVVDAKTAGVAGNSIASTTTIAASSFTSTTLLGGHVHTDEAILIGGTASATQTNVQDAVNGSGVAGTAYSLTLAPNELVYAKDFGTNASQITAKASGTDGDGIETIGTFDSGSNTFSATATSGGSTGRFDDYIPAGDLHEYAIDDSITVVGLLGHGGTATVAVVEH